MSEMSCCAHVYLDSSEDPTEPFQKTEELGFPCCCSCRHPTLTVSCVVKANHTYFPSLRRRSPHRLYIPWVASPCRATAYVRPVGQQQTSWGCRGMCLSRRTRLAKAVAPEHDGPTWLTYLMKRTAEGYGMNRRAVRIRRSALFAAGSGNATLMHHMRTGSAGRAGRRRLRGAWEAASFCQRCP